MLNNYIDGDTAYIITFGILTVIMYRVSSNAFKESNKSPYTAFFGLMGIGAFVISMISLFGFMVGVGIKLFNYLVG